MFLGPARVTSRPCLPQAQQGVAPITVRRLAVDDLGRALTQSAASPVGEGPPPVDDPNVGEPDQLHRQLDAAPGIGGYWSFQDLGSVAAAALARLCLRNAEGQL